MSDLSLDDLANCPSPEDALLLLSTGAAAAMRAMPEPERLEVCKTIVALGDVVARTHQPLLAAIKLTVGEAGGIQTTAEANGRTFHRWAGHGIMAGFTGAICAVARMESKLRTGRAHTESLEAWGRCLVDAGRYLEEIATTARSIAGEMAGEHPGVRTVQHCQPRGNMDPRPYRRPVHGDADPKRGRGGVKMCLLHRSCAHKPDHRGPCCSETRGDHDGLCSTDDDTGECGRFPTAAKPLGCIRNRGHAHGCSSFGDTQVDLLSTLPAAFVACPIPDCVLAFEHEGECSDGVTN